MDEILTNALHVRVPNVHINIFDFQFLKIDFCPIFNSIHTFFTFQKLSIIKNCIDFQFALTLTKVKNARILKITKFKIICSKFRNYEI